MNLSWRQIIYCRSSGCKKNHTKVNLQEVCSFKSLPSRKGEYLVSDGVNVGISDYEMLFNNFDTSERLVKNKDIKYWRPLGKFNHEK